MVMLTAFWPPPPLLVYDTEPSANLFSLKLITQQVPSLERPISALDKKSYSNWNKFESQVNTHLVL